MGDLLKARGSDRFFTLQRRLPLLNSRLRFDLVAMFHRYGPAYMRAAMSDESRATRRDNYRDKLLNLVRDSHVKSSWSVLLCQARATVAVGKQENDAAAERSQ